MKKYLLILFLGFGFLYNAHAQDGERLQALKIAYITKKLDLSPEEAQRFWPIYNKYTDEIKNIRQEQKQKNGSEIETEDKILGVRKKYNTEFSKVLSPEKVDKFFKSDRDFGNEVRKELQERRMNRQLNRRGAQ